MADAASGKCAVCGNPLNQGDLVVCPGCQTLYHRECWVYNGGSCALYGYSKAHAERDPLPTVNAAPWEVPQDSKSCERDLLPGMPAIGASQEGEGGWKRSVLLTVLAMVVAALTLLMKFGSCE